MDKHLNVSLYLLPYSYVYGSLTSCQSHNIGTGRQTPTYLVPPCERRERALLDDKAWGQGVTLRGVFRGRERCRQVSLLHHCCKAIQAICTDRESRGLRLVGFDDLGNSDSFPTKTLEARLARSGKSVVSAIPEFPRLMQATHAKQVYYLLLAR
jgi:hypothetical protein